MTPLRIRLAAAALGTGLLVLVPAAVLAAPAERIRPPDSERTREQAAERTRDPEELRARCLSAIDKRLAALAAASSRLAEARAVTDEHEAALSGILAATGASLGALAGEIRADDDAEALKAHCRSIFADHRVFALVLPRTRLVVASDAAVAAADRLDRLSARIEQAIAKAEAAGRDVAGAEADLDAMRAAIDSARSSAAGVADDILPLTPTDWNDDHEVLSPAREALRSARADLRAARDLARGIRAGLKA